MTEPEPAATPPTPPSIDARLELYGALTDRERAVAALLALGRTCREIGNALDMAQKTAEHHRGSVLRKLRLRNTAELARDAIRVGFVRPPDEATA